MNIQDKGSDCPTVITVEYEVKNQTYQSKESIKLKSTVIRIGFLPIGQRKTPRMPNTFIGDEAVVLYNPENPQEAYLRDNAGIMNCYHRGSKRADSHGRRVYFLYGKEILQ